MPWDASRSRRRHDRLLARACDESVVAFGLTGSPATRAAGLHIVSAMGGERNQFDQYHEEDTMKAHVGDRIIIAPLATGGTVRDGEIIETRGPDGAPPYLVRWSDDGHEGLYFPGVDARLTSTAAFEPAVPGGADTGPAGGDVPRHIRSWTLSVDVFEEGLDTSAHAVLRTDAPEPLEAHGAAHRRAADPDVPEIGDEIAVARALRHLADRLLGTAADDIQALEGRPVHLNDV